MLRLVSSPIRKSWWCWERTERARRLSSVWWLESSNRIPAQVDSAIKQWRIITLASSFVLTHLLFFPNAGEVPSLNISYKPQKISPKSTGTVRQLLHEKIRDAYIHPQFIADCMKPLKIENIIDQEVQNLSGGELQRVAMTLCLGRPADVYLIDEPSAYLDSEQRLVAAKVSRVGGRPNNIWKLAHIPCFLGYQALHFARQEDRFHCRARFHHGHVSRWPCHRLWGHPLNHDQGLHSAVSAHWHE